ncbi:unnamed protein product [Pieris macdunnoughi]|uniref:Uncharacterized protein n=1 Tax=Pieris macdunnoughi TaxID=345717 RepID=A0A821XUY0_9NEOP|nr:unnamed protein product [Pieris macdunnoughi]
MAKKTLSNDQIEYHLTIPLGTEDEQDSSGAKSDGDIAIIRSIVNKLYKTFSDTDDEEQFVSPNRYGSAAPLSGSYGGEMQQHISNPSGSIPAVHLDQLLHEHVNQQLYLPRLLHQKTLLLHLLHPSPVKSEISSEKKKLSIQQTVGFVGKPI